MVDTETQDPTVEKIRALMARRKMGQNETAHYLGIPPGTLGNWMQGTKKPSASVVRLIEVLGMVEVFAPHVHDNLIPKGKG